MVGPRVCGRDGSAENKSGVEMIGECRSMIVATRCLSMSSEAGQLDYGLRLR